MTCCEVTLKADANAAVPYSRGGRSEAQHNCIQEQRPCYLYLDSLLPLRYGAFYRQPGGSSLDPRPDLQATASAANL